MVQTMTRTGAMRLTPSLDSILDFWSKQAEGSGPMAAMAKLMMPQITAHPELRGPLNPEVLAANAELVDALVSCVLPAGLQRFSFAALATPSSFDVHWATPRFRRELLDGEGRFRGEPFLQGMTWLYLRQLFQYLSVARQLYERHFPFEKSVIIEQTGSNGLTRYFQLRAHFDHFELRAPKKLPKVSEEAWEQLSMELDDLELWKKTIPLDEFEMYGVVVYEATDITEEMTLSAIKQELVAKDPLQDNARFSRIQDHFRMLLSVDDLGLMVMGSRDGLLLELSPGENTASDWRTVDLATIHQKLSLHCQATLKDGRAIVIEDLQKAELCSQMMVDALQQGARSYLMMPLFFEGQKVGVFTFTSRVPHAFNNLTPYRLQEVTPLLALAVRRTWDTFQQRVESVIRERFTALHPAVEWKFRQQALEVVRTDHDLELLGEDIVFQNVYPLFGASDVRNSTVIRNDTIQQDLSLQLRLASGVLESAYSERRLTYLSSRRYRLKQWLAHLEHGLDSGDEPRIIEFLRGEIEPLFDTLAKFSDTVFAAVKSYREALDPRLGLVYQQRKQYEQSMTLLKERTAEILSRRQVEAQQVFPHYFELHKSDGVDHMLYVGPSIHPHGDFDPLYLRNLRLWQLETMVEIACGSRRWTSEMERVLESAHLLLVQDNPLSIRFSQDEKQFNVDGAYNARYEIIKKRLDKAEVRDTGERLTQPGKIAIVYSHPREAAEYRDYIDYLQSLGQLEGPVEELEIAPLQGVVGLRALRITAALT
ncbi:MAG: GAF domain-containing protein [Candidatus Eremiobacteraeota bacterium]|nr:GAF domain-containing protein [Candidatus Eremiobacteraeota bacterium]